MLDVRDERLRPFALEGNFGLEREALRITPEGRMAHTPHPFPGFANIVRDFCENQTEINTHVHPDAASAVAELARLDAEMRRALAGRELLWPFSSPPPLGGDDDIVPASFDGDLSPKGAYREYLSAKYGRRVMTFCGIHVNFSFGDRLVAAAGGGRDFGDRLYLHVAEQMTLWGWLLATLTAASPLLDASFFSPAEMGKDAQTGAASVRCGELGYWNHFTPVHDFSGVRAYADSIRDYVRRGFIAAPSELYFPVRLKPRGANRLASLVEGGIDRIELRCVDLNPLVGGLVDVRDVAFVQLMLLWCASRESAALSAAAQLSAVRNFKNAARFDIDAATILLPDGSTPSVRRAGLGLLDEIARFFGDFPDDVRAVVAFERGKLSAGARRYADEVRARFGGTFARKGLEWAREVGDV
ncbi:MAG: hypothetical protein IJ829_03135 [Kiritimatiellae bacterium]|nr:hypothetical protein [Kiritimatiellia bacterium]